MNDFIISINDSIAGFNVSTNPILYVKRVTGTSGSETVAELDGTDEVKFH